jgi:hypothetical protein
MNLWNGFSYTKLGFSLNGGYSESHIKEVQDSDQVVKMAVSYLGALISNLILGTSHSKH